MKRTSLIPEFLRLRHLLPALTAVCFALLFCLGSCDSGTYKFQPESTHWMQFRGPDGSGIAPPDADPPVHFSADSNVLWKTEILPGWSSPCIVNDRIFLTGFNKKDSLVHTIAVNREDGTILWKDSVRMWWYGDLHPANSYVNPTIASDGEKIYVHHPARGVAAYGLDGSHSWEFTHRSLVFHQGAASSPLLKDSLLLVTLNFRENPRIVLLDCETGDSVGVVMNPDHMPSYAGRASTPLLYGDQLILHQSRKLAGYDLWTGEVQWWLETTTFGVSTPVVYEDVVYVGTFSPLGEDKINRWESDFGKVLGLFDNNSNELLEQTEIPDSLMVMRRLKGHDEWNMNMAINTDRFFGFYDNNKDKAFDQDEWDAISEIVKRFLNHGMLALPLDKTGELSQADLLWKVQDNTPESPSPLVVGEYVVFVKTGGIMSVIRRSDGEVLKAERIAAAGPYLASPMLAGGRIYICAHNGTVTIVSADDFSVLARNKLDGKIGASPVAVDDVLYVRTSKYLYALREP